MSTLATLRSLHAAIGTALDDVERAYTSRGVDFPSLDTPVYNADFEVAFASKSETLRKGAVVSKALSIIVGACGQLSATVQNPLFSMLETSTGVHMTAAMQFLEASHTVEILRDAGPGGLHIDELADKIDYIRAGKGDVVKPLDKTWLSHILRLLAVHHWMKEVRPDVFANNRLSSALDSGRSIEQLRSAPETKFDDTNGLGALLPLTTTHAPKILPSLPEWLLYPRQGTQYDTAFNYAFETPENYYAWLERPENALPLKQMGRGMVVASRIDGGNIADTTSFPWDTLPPSSLVVDVGGGIGGTAVKIAAAHPHLRCVVQDRAQTAETAPAQWGARADVLALIAQGRVAFQAADFFAPQPAAYPGAAGRRASVFLLQRVLHNWGDDACVTILKHLRDAAGPDTRLIVSEQHIPYACPDDGPGGAEQLAPTGSPLLANMGTAYAANYHMDITMLSFFSGRERTLREYTALLGKAGWKISHVQYTPGALSAYTTAVPV